MVAEVTPQMTGERKALTPLQAKALNFIRRFINEHGYSPSFQEIADELGTTSPSIDVLVRRLVDRGWISKKPRTARSIRVLAA